MPIAGFVTPPFDDVHVVVNWMIALPLFAPGVNVTFNWPAATFTACTAVGAVGAPAATPRLAADWGLVPAAFPAATVGRLRWSKDKARVTSP